MKKIFAKMFKKVFKLFYSVQKGKILFIVTTPGSGCNATTLYHYILQNGKYSDMSIIYEGNNNISFKDRIKRLKELITSEVIITTHSAIKEKRNQVIIQLWHGITLKAMGLLDKTMETDWIKNDKFIFDNTDIIISTSTMYTTMMNSTIGQSISKYRILGFPRNDLLFNTNKEKSLQNLLNINLLNMKAVLFVPTFKSGYKGRVEGNSRENNIFGFDSFDYKEFMNFLKLNNIVFIIKLHPFEEKYYKEILSKGNNENIIFLDSNVLKNNNVDLYEILGNTDLLITDYSGIYFDYLLTEKPVLFFNPDLEKYKNIRGLLLEPYEMWTPGPKVQNQINLQNEIIKLLSDSSYFATERKHMKEIFHFYKDSNSCERTWNFIKDNYLI